MMTSRRSWLALLTATVLTLAAVTAPAAAQGRDVLVFAAASLKNALDEAAAQWQRESGKKVAISYAASNTLIKQIEQGAPADMFISADLDWMDYGSQKKVITPRKTAGSPSSRKSHCQPLSPAIPFKPWSRPDTGAPMAIATGAATMKRAPILARSRAGTQ